MGFSSSKFCERGQRWAPHTFAIALICAVAAMLGCVSAPISATADEADAAQRPPLSVAVFVTSRNDECYDNGSLTAIKRLARQAQDRINLGRRHRGPKIAFAIF